ncbi:Uncharacterised protein [Legionella pneumophila]|nr:Uncharacterised protein [Legionella pneumophila]
MCANNPTAKVGAVRTRPPVTFCHIGSSPQADAARVIRLGFSAILSTIDSRLSLTWLSCFWVSTIWARLPLSISGVPVLALGSLSVLSKLEVVIVDLLSCWINT